MKHSGSILFVTCYVRRHAVLSADPLKSADIQCRSRPVTYMDCMVDFLAMAREVTVVVVVVVLS